MWYRGEWGELGTRENWDTPIKNRKKRNFFLFFTGSVIADPVLFDYMTYISFSSLCSEILKWVYIFYFFALFFGSLGLWHVF